MSGRTLHPRDGKLITNRKTNRRQSPRKDELPQLILSFKLPEMVGLGLAAYRNIVGICTWADGRVEITGVNRQQLLEQAIDLLRAVAQHGLVRPLDIEIRRADEPKPSIRGRRRPLQLLWNGRNPTLIHGGLMRPATSGDLSYG